MIVQRLGLPKPAASSCVKYVCRGVREPARDPCRAVGAVGIGGVAGAGVLARDRGKAPQWCSYRSTRVASDARRCETLRNGNAPVPINRRFTRNGARWPLPDLASCMSQLSFAHLPLPHEQASPHARERRATPAGALLKALSTIERGMPRRWHQRRLVRTVQRTVIHKATHLTNHRHRPWWWIPQSARGFPFLQLGPESSLRTLGRPTIWRSRPAQRAGIRCLDRSDSPCWYSRGGHLPRAASYKRYVDRRTCTHRRRGQWRELFATSGLPPGRCCWAPAANEFARSRAGRRS